MLMMKPCVQMNEAFSIAVNHIKEAPMMTNALQSKTNKKFEQELAALHDQYLQVQHEETLDASKAAWLDLKDLLLITFGESPLQGLVLVVGHRWDFSIRGNHFLLFHSSLCAAPVNHANCWLGPVLDATLS